MQHNYILYFLFSNLRVSELNGPMTCSSHCIVQSICCI